MNTRQQLYTEGTSALAIRSPIWNAAIYCRLSVEDQNLQESGSIQTQRAMLTDYCQQNGINVVDYYIDDGISGATFKRPAFEQMISDIEAGKVNTVVVKDAYVKQRINVSNIFSKTTFDQEESTAPC